MDIHSDQTKVRKMNQPQGAPQERRRQPRKPSNAVVDYHFKLPSGRVYGSGRAVNISRSGICFRCSHYIPVGTLFEVSIARADGGRIDAVGQLIYVLKVPGQPLYQCGARFARFNR